MVKFKPDLKEVRDIEDEFEQSDEDFDLSEFIPQGMLKSLIRLNERLFCYKRTQVDSIVVGDWPSSFTSRWRQSGSKSGPASDRK